MLFALYKKAILFLHYIIVGCPLNSMPLSAPKFLRNNISQSLFPLSLLTGRLYYTDV